MKLLLATQYSILVVLQNKGPSMANGQRELKDKSGNADKREEAEDGCPTGQTNGRRNCLGVQIQAREEKQHSRATE